MTSLQAMKDHIQELRRALEVYEDDYEQEATPAPESDQESDQEDDADDLMDMSGYQRGRYFGIHDYIQCFRENLENIEGNIDELEPNEALERLGLCADNLLEKFKEDEMHYTMDIDDSIAVHTVVAELLKRHNMQIYGMVDLDCIDMIGCLEPSVARLCFDYPQNIDLDDLQYASIGKKDIIDVVQDQITEYPHISKNGKYVFSLDNNYEQGDYRRFMCAEKNRRITTYKFGEWFGGKTQILTSFFIHREEMLREVGETPELRNAFMEDRQKIEKFFMQSDEIFLPATPIQKTENKQPKNTREYD